MSCSACSIPGSVNFGKKRRSKGLKKRSRGMKRRSRGMKKRRVNPDAKKAMRLYHSKKGKISLKQAWKIVRGRGFGRKFSGRKKRQPGDPKGNGNPQAKKAMEFYRSGKAKSLKEAWAMVKSGSIRSRMFGKRSFGRKMGKSQTSYPNVYAPYFGTAEPFVNPSEWYLPQAGGKIQSPEMLMKLKK